MWGYFGKGHDALDRGCMVNGRPVKFDWGPKDSGDRVDWGHTDRLVEVISALCHKFHLYTVSVTDGGKANHDEETPGEYTGVGVYRGGWGAPQGRSLHRRFTSYQAELAFFFFLRAGGCADGTAAAASRQAGGTPPHSHRLQSSGHGSDSALHSPICPLV